MPRPCRSRGRPPGSGRAARRGRRAARRRRAGSPRRPARAIRRPRSRRARRRRSHARQGCRAGTRRRPRGESMAGRRKLVPVADQPVEQLDLGPTSFAARLVEVEPLSPVDLGELLRAARARRPLHREGVAATASASRSPRRPTRSTSCRRLHDGAEVDQLPAGAGVPSLLLELAQRAGPRVLVGSYSPLGIDHAPRSLLRPERATRVDEQHLEPTVAHAVQHDAGAAPSRHRLEEGGGGRDQIRSWSAGRRRRGRWR